MKNAFILLLLFAPLLAICQTRGEFELTPSGFVNKADRSLDYIVLEYPSVSQADLYKRTLKSLAKQLVSPKDAISKIENESITVNSIDNRIPVKGYSGAFNLDYTMTIEFKDGKLRLLAPSINAIYGYPVRDIIKIGVSGDGFNRTIFDKKGSVKLEKTKQVIEMIFKAWVLKISIGIEEGKNDNW